MRKTIIAAVSALFIGGAGVLTLAAPAFADTTAGTPVTVEVTGGALSITVPGTIDLGTTAAAVDAQTVTGSLGDVEVTDARGGVLGWVTTAGSTAFTGGAGIPATAETYTPGDATVTGTSSVQPATLSGMTSGGDAVQTATDVTGANTATWDPSIAVLVPAGAIVATYSATITHSVS
jgi:hypothetical protein